MNVPSSWILSGNGSDQMLGFLIQYYLQENKILYTLSPDFSMYEMKKISEAFKDIPVIFDEAYMEFGKESAVCLLKEYPNVFVCRTLSKAYGLAGIRCGFMISSQVEKLSALFIPYALSN